MQPAIEIAGYYQLSLTGHGWSIVLAGYYQLSLQDIVDMKGYMCGAAIEGCLYTSTDQINSAIIVMA